MDQGEWNEDKLYQYLPQEIAEYTQQHLSITGNIERWDRPWWMPNSSGDFIVKSAWDMIRRKREIQQHFQEIWIKGLPFKISLFIWRLWKQKLPIDDILSKIGIAIVFKCHCCSDPSQETTNHLFITCSFAASVWTRFARGAGLQGPFLQVHQTVQKWWKADCSIKMKPIFKAIPALIM